MANSSMFGWISLSKSRPWPRSANRPAFEALAGSVRVMEIIFMQAKQSLLTSGAALLLAVTAASAVGQPKFSSHAPMRPLPTATVRPLEKGTTYFVDAARGDDKQDGSEAKPFKTIQHGVNRLKPGETLYLRGGT